MIAIAIVTPIEQTHDGNQTVVPCAACETPVRWSQLREPLPWPIRLPLLRRWTFARNRTV